MLWITFQIHMMCVSQYLPVNPVIIEAGAYNGIDTEQMVKIWPKSTIYSFEPVAAIYKQLFERVKFYPNVHSFSLALADRDESRPFWVSTFPWGGNSGSSSLLPPKNHLEFDLSKFDQKIDVLGLKLDTWAKWQNVERIDFAWLGMQGFELPMLKASRLSTNIKVIYIEVGFVEMYEGQPIYKDVKDWMLKNDYELKAIDFNEEIALKGRKAIWPGNSILYY